MTEAISHILDQSVCLTRRQMKDYIGGAMLAEEQHAAELHLSSCPLCSMAMEGFEEHSEEALAAIASLNSGFLKEHYDAVTPQIHLNSVAPAMTASSPRRHKGIAQPLYRNIGIAATILLAVSLFWFMKSNHESSTVAAGILADNATPAAAPSQPVNTDRAPAVIAESSAARAFKSNPAVNHAQKSIVASSENAGDDASLPASKLSPAPAPAQDHQKAQLKETEIAAGTIAAKDVRPVAQHGPSAANAGNASNIQIGGGRAAGKNIIVDGVAARSAKSAAAAHLNRPGKIGSMPAQVAESSARPGAGDAAEQSKQATMATQYDEQMMRTDGSRRSRHAAGIQAAKSYIAAGQKAKAITVLNAIIAEGGPQKKAAKKLLRELKSQ